MPAYLACFWEESLEDRGFLIRRKEATLQKLRVTYNFWGGNIFLSDGDYNSEVLCGALTRQYITYGASLKIQSSSNWCQPSFKWVTLHLPNELFPVKKLYWCKSTFARTSSESAGSDRHVLANSGWRVEICFPGSKSKHTKGCPRLRGGDVLINKAMALSEHKTHTRKISWQEANQSITTRAT